MSGIRPGSSCALHECFPLDASVPPRLGLTCAWEEREAPVCARVALSLAREGIDRCQLRRIRSSGHDILSGRQRVVLRPDDGAKRDGRITGWHISLGERLSGGAPCRRVLDDVDVAPHVSHVRHRPFVTKERAEPEIRPRSVHEQRVGMNAGHHDDVDTRFW